MAANADQLVALKLHRKGSVKGTRTNVVNTEMNEFSIRAGGAA